MNLAVGHIGTLAQSHAAVAAALSVRAPEAAKPVQARSDEQAGKTPVAATQKSGFENPRAWVRDEVMAERGLDLHDLMRLPAFARMQTEAAVETEVANRLASRNKRLLDIRV